MFQDRSFTICILRQICISLVTEKFNLKIVQVAVERKNMRTSAGFRARSQWSEKNVTYSYNWYKALQLLLIVFRVQPFHTFFANNPSENYS